MQISQHLTMLSDQQKHKKKICEFVEQMTSLSMANEIPWFRTWTISCRVCSFCYLAINNTLPTIPWWHDRNCASWARSNKQRLIYKLPPSLFLARSGAHIVILTQSWRTYYYQLLTEICDCLTIYIYLLHQKYYNYIYPTVFWWM